MEFSAETWKPLAATGAEVRFGTGENILRQGDPPTHVSILLSGRVKVLTGSADGTVLLLAVRSPGELLGSVGVIGRHDRSATVVALEPCITRVLAADRFRELIRAHGLEEALLRRTMRRILEGEAWRAELAALPAGPRVARALERLATPGADGLPEVNLDQTEIGQAVGLSRSMVAAALSRFRERGLVRTERRRIVVRDLAGLRALAGSGQRDI
ncbi:Crp/Fnr family transcriptional regulator [Actinocorallia populi]|uniref:Crp/Fnr family transcriptional regulator n=1 Tax=Actinocorallia populi TaxID=2079200 RepID=UPI000D088E08|nr:Crp/Fnr family transcriptional regulator [Actinocorallia populi]